LGELVVGAGVGAEGGERLVDGDVPAFREDSLGLFEDDAAGQGVLELGALDLVLCGGALLQQGDGRDVCQGLGQGDVLGVEGVGVGLEEGEGADDPAAQP
jgi:hypothetical protein